MQDDRQPRPDDRTAGRRLIDAAREARAIAEAARKRDDAEK